MPLKITFVSLLLLLGVVPLGAARSTNPDVNAKAVADLRSLRDADLRVGTVAFKMATRAVRLCHRTEPQVGILLQDLSQYRPDLRKAAVTVFNLGNGPAVEGVVPLSPAALAGIKPGDVVTDIGGQPVREMLPVDLAKRKNFDRVQTLINVLDQALKKGAVDLGLMRDGNAIFVHLVPQIACASRIQLVPGNGLDAEADGEVVSISTALLRELKNDDELAFVIAHEMAHNILGHRAKLESEGVSFGLLRSLGANVRKIRETEIEADYFALYLMTDAGFNPSSAPEFYRRIEHKQGLGFLADATHLNGEKRQIFLSRTVQEVTARQRNHLPLEPDMAKARSF